MRMIRTLSTAAKFAIYAAADQRAADQDARSVESAVAADRARTRHVLTSPECLGREALAAELLDSDLTAERIIAALAKAPSRLSSGPKFLPFPRPARPSRWHSQGAS